LLFERIHYLSARGSRVAVEAFGAGFFDPEYLASRRKKLQQYREQSGTEDNAFDVQDLWFIEERTEVADWLTAHGWEVTAIGAADLMDHYGRCAAADDTTPRTLFVEGRLPV
jgi:O-methyltransferase involved in polyketide biosynthesis